MIKIFNTILRKLREEHELKQEDLAKELNISSVAYGKYERGESEPDIKSLIKLSNIFNVSIDYLVWKNQNKINNYKDKFKTLNKKELIEIINKQLDLLLMEE